MTTEQWLLIATALVVGFMVARIILAWHSPRFRDDADLLLAAKQRYMREVEKHYGNLDVPAFLRETSTARRSRYIGKR